MIVKAHIPHGDPVIEKKKYLEAVQIAVIVEILYVIREEKIFLCVLIVM